MCESIEIISSTNKYKVNFLNNIKSLDDNKYYLIDEVVYELYRVDFKRLEKVIVVPAIEESKTLEFAAEVINKLKELGVVSSSILCVVGGGVLQDLGTFVASIYMRGIKWELYPTTLLSMADSCIGGKSSINISEYKNLAGNFYPPSEINIYIGFIKTLSQDRIIEGLVEAEKILFVSQGKVYKPISYNSSTEYMDYSKRIYESLSEKKKIIEADEFDKGIRRLLNFGHTFGHAIESASKFRIKHGIAVGIGILLARKFANRNCEVNLKYSKLDIFKILIEQVPEQVSILKDLCIDDIMKAFDADKKHSEGSYRIIIPIREEKVAILEIPRTENYKIKNLFEEIQSI